MFLWLKNSEKIQAQVLLKSIRIRLFALAYRFFIFITKLLKVLIVFVIKIKNVNVLGRVCCIEYWNDNSEVKIEIGLKCKKFKNSPTHILHFSEIKKNIYGQSGQSKSFESFYLICITLKVCLPRSNFWLYYLDFLLKYPKFVLYKTTDFFFKID